MPSGQSEGYALLADFSASDANAVFGQVLAIEDIDAIIAGSTVGEAVTSAAIDDPFWGSDFARYRPYSVTDGVLTIPVKGVLLSGFTFAFGGFATGYEYIIRAVRRADEDDNVKMVVLDVHSPGGMVTQVTDCSEALRKLSSKKKLVAFCETAASAAYWLASQCSHIAVSKTGQVGSIGVITSHTDYSKAMEGIGIRQTNIFAGARKADGSPYEPLSDEARAAIQRRINATYATFCEEVATGRGMDEKAVRDTEADTFDAKTALSKGLVDQIVSRAEFAHSADVVADQGADQDDDNEEEEASMTTPAQNAKTYDDGVSDALARASSIMSMPEASGREDLAKTLAFDPSISAETAKKIMAAAPQSSAAAPAKVADPAESAAKTVKSPIDRLMEANGTPGVGPSSQADKATSVDKDDPDGQVAAILSMMNVK